MERPPESLKSFANCIASLAQTIESMHMMRKGQVKRLDGRDSVGEAEFVESLFGVAA